MLNCLYLLSVLMLCCCFFFLIKLLFSLFDKFSTVWCIIVYILGFIFIDPKKGNFYFYFRYYLNRLFYCVFLLHFNLKSVLHLPSKKIVSKCLTTIKHITLQLSQILKKWPPMLLKHNSQELLTEVRYAIL